MGAVVWYIPIYISNEMRTILRRPMRVVFAFHCAPDPNNIHVNNELHRVTYRARVLANRVTTDENIDVDRKCP